MRIPLLVSILAFTLSGCAASIGPPGPMGPPGSPGPAGPMGPMNAGPQRLTLLRSPVDVTVPDDIDVIVTEGAAVTVTLPPASLGRGRTVTVRAFAGTARIAANGTDLIDTAAAHELDRGEMATLVSDGDRRWIIIASSDL